MFHEFIFTHIQLSKVSLMAAQNCPLKIESNSLSPPLSGPRTASFFLVFNGKASPWDFAKENSGYWDEGRF